MCDPNTGEPIEALGCGPCDTKYHDHFPEQVNLLERGGKHGDKINSGQNAPVESIFTRASYNYKGENVVLTKTLDIEQAGE